MLGNDADVGFMEQFNHFTYSLKNEWGVWLNQRLVLSGSAVHTVARGNYKSGKRVIHPSFCRLYI